MLFNFSMASGLREENLLIQTSLRSGDEWAVFIFNSCYINSVPTTKQGKATSEIFYFHFQICNYDQYVPPLIKSCVSPCNPTKR